jgi:tetraacyldisaccharide 4'-kinase
MREVLQRAWLHRGPLACLLYPLSLVFGLAAALRRHAYRRGLLKTHRVRVPVIVVGNVVAGGSGKTPIVQAIVQRLKSRGLRVGVVSRGYGRRTTDCREVTASSDPAQAGDEPLLIARSCGAPVFVAASRVEAAEALLRAHPATQVIVSDDGLQHDALARDIEICVFDDRGIGNGWLLPAGPLREPWPRDVDFVIGPLGHAVRRERAPEAIRGDGKRMPVSDLRHVTAVAGIAKPHSFFDMLRAAGAGIDRTIALADHHDFASPPDAKGTIVCTEKDAVKLWRTRPDAWAVPLHVRIPSEFWTAFDAKLSSALDGSQTA